MKVIAAVLAALSLSACTPQSKESPGDFPRGIAVHKYATGDGTVCYIVTREHAASLAISCI